jgi:hypothetical protein
MVVPAAATAVWEKEAAAHAQHDQQWNQQCDSTKHFYILSGTYKVNQSGSIRR